MIENNDKYYVLADIHGAYKELMQLIAIMSTNGFDLSDPTQHLVQTGDRNDRGAESYRVNQFFKELQKQYPNQVHVLNGNHDDMLLDAAKMSSDLMYFNGGNATLHSYERATGLYGKLALYYMLRDTGHWDWLKSLPYYYETDKYFFCHAPILKPHMRQELAPGIDFRQDKQQLTWGYPDGIRIEDAVDTKLIPIEEDGNFYGKYKTCVYGHIHAGEYKYAKYYTPNPQLIENVILLDSGCSCWQGAVLSCVELPSMQVYQSDGNTFNLKTEELKRKNKEAEDKQAMMNKIIDDKKVEF
jgi:hypothetical protein